MNQTPALTSRVSLSLAPHAADVPEHPERGTARWHRAEDVQGVLVVAEAALAVLARDAEAAVNDKSPGSGQHAHALRRQLEVARSLVTAHATEIALERIAAKRAS